MNGLRIAVFGLGEAGNLFARDLAAAGARVVAYEPRCVPTPEGVTRVDEPGHAVADAAAVMSFTTAQDAMTALDQALDAIPKTAVYADCCTAAASLKKSLAAHAATAALQFADVALMAPVPGKGLRTPALVSGTGAARFVSLIAPLGMPVEDVGGAAGLAATRKLLRSVVIKGFAGLLIESMRAANAAGLGAETWSTLVEQFGEADEAFLRRIVSGTFEHAHRRLHEMEATAQLLDDLGVDPVITRATVESLRRIDAGDDADSPLDNTATPR